jgi:hypothetical protein
LNQQISLVSVLGIFGLGTQPQLGFSKSLWYDSGTELQPQTLENIFALLGSQPKLGNSQNIFASLGSQTLETWKFLNILLCWDLNLNLEILEIFAISLQTLNSEFAGFTCYI